MATEYKFYPALDADLPRRDRQFPLRAAGPHEVAECNRDIEKVLITINNMLFDLARKRLPAGTCRSDLEDAVQATRVHLWLRSLPRYDAHRRPRVKPGTFAYVCASRYLASYKRDLLRRRKLKALPASLRSPDRRDDRIVEQFADELVSNPEAYFSSKQAVIIRNLEKRTCELAAATGTSAPTISDRKLAARQRIRRLADDLVTMAK